ncbi:hypothetical protein DCCM_4398 [Desulfocucumis palustris]|uniref:Uncharacterized protein n=1 Tax=Desulfocucumis palustris TaxID=1898651 RepID=A0A2L2XGF0_9FIRM|nr:hypothetical protein DCCM_4398 [Desulfocucumis palustris]
MHITTGNNNRATRNFPVVSRANNRDNRPNKKMPAKGKPQKEVFYFK